MAEFYGVGAKTIILRAKVRKIGKLIHGPGMTSKGLWVFTKEERDKLAPIKKYSKKP